MFRTSILVALSVAFLLPCRAQEASGLPIERVVLYKNGVGYFEHLGHVRDSQDIAISFTSGQLNDVLKSLTVLDLNGGRITGVAYGSAAPADRQLGDLRLSLGEKATLADFLGGLRGARLEVRSATAAIGGRLLSVERKYRAVNGATIETDTVSLITDNGELRTAELSPSVSIRLLDRGLAGKVDRYLDIASAAREPDVRRMVISTGGTGERSVFVSYISEVPVWKTTYRIVLSSKTGESPLLQGWAIVDNTVGEDWDKVQLSLVAGAPQSFIQNLSQPYYARRPVLPLPEAVNMAPQTFEATLIPGGARLTGTVADLTGAGVPNSLVRAYDAKNAMVGEARTDAEGNYDLESVPAGAIRLQIDSPGFQRAVINGVIASAGASSRQDVALQVGGTSETVEVTAAAPGAQTETSARRSSLGSGAGLGAGSEFNKLNLFTKLRPGSGGGYGPALLSTDSARANVQAAAAAQQLGDLFEYKVKQPITIRKNRSALVPIIQSPIAAEKVSVYNERAGLPRPQRALWLTNSSGLTLDGGSFSVLDEETFAGEGVVDPIRPGEKRLVSYAIDLALNVSTKVGSAQQRITRVRANKGILIHTSAVRETKTYTFRNEDSSAREVVIEHPVRPRYELRGSARPVETTSAWMRFRLHVEPKQTAALVVDEERPVEATYALSSLTEEQVALFARQQSVNKTIEDALGRILAQKAAAADLDAQKDAREDEAQRIFDDQQRLRENMKALKGSPEEKALIQRYTQQLSAQEDRLEALRKETAQLQAKRDSAQAALDRMVQELSFDVKL